jgi:hypothetical protein
MLVDYTHTFKFTQTKLSSLEHVFLAFAHTFGIQILIQTFFKLLWKPDNIKKKYFIQAPFQQTWRQWVECRNPNLGLTTKARGCKVAGEERHPIATSHVPGSAKSVREWNLTPISELPCWELKSQKDSQIFRAQLQGSKILVSKFFLYHCKAIEVCISKIGSHRPFEHLKHKLWPKERPGVKLEIWLPTTKSQESTRFPCVHVKCDIPLESSWRGLQLCFRPHHNRRFAQEVMHPQRRESPSCCNFGTPTWESKDKKPFGCGPRGETQSIL